jgi:hypothetical protein
MSDWLGLILLIGVWILNFGISTFNAIGAGRVWSERPEGWMKLVIWSVVIMAVAGFTWCYLIVIVLLAGATGFLDPIYVQGSLELGYILIIFPVLGAGLVMWIQSLVMAFRTRSIWNILIAGWNTFAMISNAWSAFTTLPSALKNVGGLLKGGGDAKGKGLLVMILLVVLAIAGGIITTYCLMKWSEKQRNPSVRHQCN